MNEYSWKFFTSSESTWNELLSACEKAQKTIDIENYVFGAGGEIEMKFTEVFLKKRKEGVQIRMLLDVVGSFSFYRSREYNDLQKAGVEIHYHLFILPPSVKRLFPFMLRDHRKLVVVDGTVGYTGGVIIQERARHWRDTFVRIEGEVVADMQMAFTKSWNRTKKMRPVGQVKSANENKEFWIAGNSFHLHDKDLYRAFLKAITSAKKYVYITTPYFFPNDEFLYALHFAKEREVDVRLLLPEKSDNKIADILASFYYKNLKKHGIRIHFYTDKILHAKTIVVDGLWASVGSCNFDWLSFWLNYELNLISTNRDFAHELEAQFLKDLESSREMI